jgi:RimJ/RimL family protein N-acetyltransferase
VFSVVQRYSAVFNGVVSELSPTGAPGTLGPEISGHGLRLRPWCPEAGQDVDAWLRGVRDPEFLRWNTPLTSVETVEQAQAALRGHAEKATQGHGVSFCVTDEATGAVLGHLGLGHIDHLLRIARMGYWVLPAARGRHVAVRALALASAWSFNALRLHRLEVGHALGHNASCRVAERCGYRYEGLLRGAMFEEGRRDAFRDAHLHGRLATDPYPPVEPEES